MDPDKVAPFELGPDGPEAKAAVLLVHGFTGSPWDLRPLGEALARSGFFARAIRLPGHGDRPEALLDVGWQDWERAVLDAVDALEAHARVFVAGLSMGALLAVIAAAYRRDRIHALALLSPAVELRAPAARLLRFTRRLPFLHLFRPWVTKDVSDIADPVALGEAPILSAWPTARLYDLFTLQDRCAHMLAAVRAPALVMVAAQDHVVTPDGGARLARGLRHSREVRLMHLEQGFHILPRDHGRERVAREVIDFFERVR